MTCAWNVNTDVGITLNPVFDRSVAFDSGNTLVAKTIDSYSNSIQWFKSVTI